MLRNLHVAFWETPFVEREIELIHQRSTEFWVWKIHWGLKGAHPYLHWDPTCSCGDIFPPQSAHSTTTLWEHVLEQWVRWGVQRDKSSVTERGCLKSNYTWIVPYYLLMLCAKEEEGILCLAWEQHARVPDPTYGRFLELLQEHSTRPIITSSKTRESMQPHCTLRHIKILDSPPRTLSTHLTFFTIEMVKKAIWQVEYKEITRPFECGREP